MGKAQRGLSSTIVQPPSEENTMSERLRLIKRGLTAGLGEAPGAYFVAALWAITGLMIVAIMANITFLIYSDGARLDASLEPFTLLLPLALLATLAHHFVTRPESPSRRSMLTGL